MFGKFFRKAARSPVARDIINPAKVLAGGAGTRMSGWMPPIVHGMQRGGSGMGGALVKSSGAGMVRAGSGGAGFFGGAKQIWSNMPAQAQHAAVGAGIGGAWGMVSDDTSVLGGAAMGAIGGAGAYYGRLGIGAARTAMSSNMGIGKAVMTGGRTAMDFAVAGILVKAGYLKDVQKKTIGKKNALEIKLAYMDDQPVLNDFKILSKPSRHFYTGYRKLKTVKQGYGLSVISTPSGIMSGKEAKKTKVGGEYLFEIW